MFERSNNKKLIILQVQWCSLRAVKAWLRRLMWLRLSSGSSAPCSVSQSDPREAWRVWSSQVLGLRQLTKRRDDSNSDIRPNWRKSRQGAGQPPCESPHPWAGACPASQTVQETWGVKAYLRGERECLTVAPGLGARRGIQGSEPQSQAASMVSISGNKVAVNKGIFRNIFFMNGGTPECPWNI